MADSERPAENPNQAYLDVLEAALRDGDNEFASSLLESGGPFENERELGDVLVSTARAADAAADKALWYGGVELVYDHCNFRDYTPETRETLHAAHQEARHFLDVYYQVRQVDDMPGMAPVDDIAETHDPTDPFAGLVEADDLVHRAAVDVELYDPEGWESDHFEPDAREELIQEYPVLTAAIERVQRTKDLESVITRVQEEVDTELADLFRIVLDKYVFQFAEGMITGRYNVAAGIEIVEKHASSPEIAFRMRLALDKFVMREARNMIKTFSSPGSARQAIVMHASTSRRRDAMLEELGMI